MREPIVVRLTGCQRDLIAGEPAAVLASVKDKPSAALKKRRPISIGIGGRAGQRNAPTVQPVAAS